jgi:hypothetical protein
MLERPAHNPTHQIMDGPEPCWWRPDLGVFVVPVAQCVDDPEGVQHADGGVSR